MADQELTQDAPSLRDAVTDLVAEMLDVERNQVNVMIQVHNENFEDARAVSLTARFEGEEPVAHEDEDQDWDEDEEDEDLPEGIDDDLDEEAEAGADFVEGILDILEMPGDLKIRLFEDHAEVEVVNVDGGPLIGRRGSTLEAIQELLRCSLQREFQRRSRVKVDVEGYRARRLEKLEEKAHEAIGQVQSSGESERLEPMDVFERKAIHQLVAAEEGVTSRSQGREPSRRVVIEAE